MHNNPLQKKKKSLKRKVWTNLNKARNRRSSVLRIRRREMLPFLSQRTSGINIRPLKRATEDFWKRMHLLDNSRLDLESAMKLDSNLH